MESQLFEAIMKWCRTNDNIRAAVLTSSRARKDGSADILSDYDLELFVEDTAPFLRNDKWLEQFGPILVRWPLEPETTFSDDWITRLIQYEEGTRIDLQITCLSLDYHESFDAGYEILIDRDRQGAALPPPRMENLLIKKPTQKEYADRVNAFFWDILYVPKALKRDELFWASYMRDDAVRFGCLLPMLEWYAAMNHGWNLNTNKYGRWIKPYLSEEIWSLCENTFTGAGLEENRRALHGMVSLFSRLAREVGDGLGYPYPEEQEKGIRAFIGKIENTELPQKQH